MSNQVSALNGLSATGDVSVRDCGLQGMITLRGDLGAAKLRKVCKDVTGFAVPKQRGVACEGETGIAWMSPDELLLLVPHADVAETLTKIDTALKGLHHLAANVSDARVLLEVQGEGVRDVMARLFPVDLHPDSFHPGELRRTRMAQVPAALWMRDETTFNVICFRSVAQYAFDVLANAAASPRAGVF